MIGVSPRVPSPLKGFLSSKERLLSIFRSKASSRRVFGFCYTFILTYLDDAVVAEMSTGEFPGNRKWSCVAYSLTLSSICLDPDAV